jgi:hypothetical protein
MYEFECIVIHGSARFKCTPQITMKGKDQRAESREQRAESREQRAEIIAHTVTANQWCTLFSKEP